MNKLEIRQKAMALKRYQPYLAMIFIQILYAGMALFSKASISNGMNPYVFVVYRQAFATLALAPFAIFLESNKTTSLSFSLLVKIFFISLLGITLSLDLCYVSISYISATFAAAGTNMIPVITFILAICFRMESICYKQSHGIAKIIGSVVCVAGALIYAFVNGPPLYPESHKQVHYLTSNGTSKGEWIKGSLIMLLANTMWSLWLILQGPIMKQYPAKIRLTTLQCLFSCIQSAIWAISVKRDIAAWKLGFNFNLLSVAYCGVLVAGLSYWLRAWVIEIKGPVFTAMFTPLSLIVTAVFSSIFWKETPHLGSVCGAILLVMGLYGVLWGKQKEAECNKKTSDQCKEEINSI
ncbi:WAT1-related protein At1g43650 isoform X1 [Nicotiana tomentosiformis]|uniref:WAT1-related protein n=1 Tax=Nicotiana tabacum TaxID=4097 RepID=A0A1S4CLF7_TOBAC|nr:WAT1-related protein At1g43650 isoform X1 [Nicotiana tomentosiformis]XP_016501881.1 PREDICTED: WAT1-related protein At1g43650-like isoform X1 [Nicotiana tabacum]